MPDLEIKVSGTVKTDVEKMGESLKTGYEKGAISADKFRAASIELEKMTKAIEKGVFTEADLKTFKNSFKAISGVLDAATKKLVKQTDEMIAAEKKKKEAQERIDKLQYSKASAKEVKTKAITDYSDFLTKKGVSVGTRGKGTTNLETFIKNKDNFKDGKVSPNVKYYKGNEEVTGSDRGTITKKLNELVAQYNAQLKQEKELDGQLATAKQELIKATKEYAEQERKDTAAGKTQNTDFNSAVMEATGGVHADISDMSADFAAEKEKQAIINSDVSLGAFGAGAEKTASSLGKVVKQFSLFAIGLRLTKKALQEVKTTITDLDKSLTEQAMVTGKTRKEVYGLLTTYQDMAISLGSTTKEVSATMTEYIRQGKSVTDAMTLTTAAISAAKVAAISTSDSINYLTTALNGFQMSASEAMLVSDKFAAVSASAATSYEEIAIALSKVASQANLAGMSIDYTTALLAKGLETTREAPETIGTALKTIIARMREIEDFGETLEDGVDLNNVETQLAYVGIQLKNTNGDLRSTEDVLNELGQKWDTLNSNQQAAIAKALAGTRQQSRLIAMMSDYERVTELQEISARSAGATMAQMETYTQGLEAALNRLSTSWEKIVSTVTNSDTIVFLVDVVTGLLDNVNNILNNTVGMIAVLVSVAVVSATILKSKIQEKKMNDLIFRSQLEQRKEQLLLHKEKLKTLLTEKQSTKAEQEQTLAAAKTRLEKAKTNKDTTEIADAQKAVTEAEQALAQTEIEIAQTKNDIKTIDGELIKNDIEQQKLSSGLLGNLMQMVPILGTILTIYQTINAARRLGIALTKKKGETERAEQAKNAPGQQAEIMAGLTGQGGFVGAAIAAAIIALLFGGVAIAAILNATGAFKSDTEKTDEKLKELNSSIYNLTKTAQAVQTVEDAIEDFDNKLIKTKKDTDELAEALDNIADKFSSSEEDNKIWGLGMSEKDYYNTLTTNEKKDFVKMYEDVISTELTFTRRQMRDTLSDYGRISTETQKMSARTLVKNDVYDIIDSSYASFDSADKTALREFSETIVENFDNETLLDYATNMGSIKTVLAEVANIKVNNSSAISVLKDESVSLKDRVAAYKSLKQALLDDATAYDAFKEAYSEFDFFEQLGDGALDAISSLKLTNEELNDLYDAYGRLSKALKDTNFAALMSADEFQDAIANKFLPSLAIFSDDISSALHYAFDDFLNEADNYEEAWNALVNEVGKTIQTGILNIGQNVDKLKNSISGVYETAEKWSTMTSTQRAQYLSENASLFQGKDGAALKQAFELGDYNAIQNALRNNATLSENLANQIAEVKRELDIERAYVGDQRNEAYIAELEKILAELESSDIFRASLQAIIEQENKRIEAFKKTLEAEEQALTDSLNKRKEAYQKYFEAINQSQEDEDYEEKAEMLVANLSKLAGSTNATSQNQIEELENSLAELEKERLQTLRERAQEAVIQSIDDTISLIEQDFEQLLATNQAILDQLRGTSAEELLARSLSQDDFISMTANEAQQHLLDLQSTYGNQLNGVDWSNITVTDNGNTLNLNVNGQVIELSKENQQNVFEAVLRALTETGETGGIV